MRSLASRDIRCFPAVDLESIMIAKFGKYGIIAAVGVGVLIFGSSGVERLWERVTGAPRLISVEEVPDTGESCYRPASEETTRFSAPNRNLFADFGEPGVQAQDGPGTINLDRPPVRMLRDTAPIYSSVAVDGKTDEVFLQDNNLWSIRVFSRLDNAKPGAPPTEARRVIAGNKTDVQFNSCVYIDPINGDVYSVENDIGDVIVTFTHDATGDVAPARKLKVTHRAYAMAMDEANQEFFVSIQHPPQVAVYRRGASGDEKPKRLLIGDKTQLSDSHGMTIDANRKLLFVNNWGNIADDDKPGSGRFGPPSITVYRLNANGDEAPLRIIQGPKTTLDWPGAMSLDSETGDLYVANDMGQSIIAFHGTDQGDVAPARMIKGPNAGLSYPVGVFVDSKNKEVWASNIGNSTATVYPLMANGDVAPLRKIRSAEEGKQSLRFGKTQALAYDSIREQVLVPN
jgi:6-phosphogluconolactonase (cycloisomerase 2 family)